MKKKGIRRQINLNNLRKKFKIFEIEVLKCVQTRVKYADTGMVQINRFLI